AVNRTDVDKAVLERYLDGTIVPHGETLPTQVEQILENNSYWTTNLYTSYDLDINEKHFFSWMIGNQLESDNSTRLSARKINLIVPEVPSLQTADGDVIVNQGLGHWSTFGTFGR